MKKSFALLAAPLLALTACGSSDTASGDDGTISVVTSFYPLQYAIEEIGGDHVEVTNLTKPGGEPHDVELSPKDVLAVAKADSVIYLKDFQPAVDDAVKEASSPFDVSPAAHLDLAASEDGHDHGSDHGHDEEHGSDDEHDHGAQDPHFWLDPTKYADVADAIADELGRVDPAHADDYTAGATALRERLTSLDATFTKGLKDCRYDELVTSHAAFGYLAARYGLHQEGITGLDPEAEPSASQMASVVKHIKEHKVPTIYAETLVPRDVADTIAAEAGAEVLVLDPIEAITDESAAQDYFGVMEANISTLRKGQECT